MAAAAMTGGWPLQRTEAGICCTLVVAQSGLLAYLLHFNAPGLAGMVIFAGLPLAWACYALLTRCANRADVQRGVLMVAAGGFGLLLGCTADFGALGFYGLIGVCRSWASGSGAIPERLWDQVELMPWAWAGMLLGSNAAMAWAALHRRARSIARACGIFTLCNAGMLFGMLAAEQGMTRVTLGWDQTVAGIAMFAGMIAGMVLGMHALLAAAQAVRFLSVSPVR